MQSYYITYTTKNNHGYTWTLTATIMASNIKFATRALRRKVKKPIKVVDATCVGYY
jgi:hypothetical protein